MDVDINANFINVALYRKFASKSKDIVTNVFFHSQYESDLITTSSLGYITEIEVKISSNDFRNDFKKAHNVYSEDRYKIIHRQLKHDWIKTGQSGLKRFYFATPKGLLNPQKIPKHCGLLEIDKYGTVEIKVRACQLIKPRKITTDQQHKLDSVFKWRYRDLWKEKNFPWFKELTEKAWKERN